MKAPLDSPESFSSRAYDASCEGVPGSLTFDNSGALSWTPLRPQQPKLATPICPCPPEEAGSFNLQQVLPPGELLGASSEAPGTLRVWYCEAVRSKACGTPKVQYRLRKTGNFECGSREAAEQLQAQIRRQASWWGRTRPQHLVVMYNPKSGTAKAASVVNDTLLPMLRDAAGLRVTVQETQGPGHAMRLVEALNLSDVDMVVYVGGDGTVFEGLQGLLNRPDWHTARQVPFAHVPGGSGNGLAASCGLWDPVTAAFAIAKGRTQPLDIASVLQPPGRRYFSFLSLVFGFWANIDIGTESLRWMGDLRYTLKAVTESLALKPYPACIAYWPHHVQGPQADPPVPPMLPVLPLTLRDVESGTAGAVLPGETTTASSTAVPWSRPPPELSMEGKPTTTASNHHQVPSIAAHRSQPLSGGSATEEGSQLRTALLGGTEGAYNRSSSGGEGAGGAVLPDGGGTVGGGTSGGMRGAGMEASASSAPAAAAAAAAARGQAGSGGGVGGQQIPGFAAGGPLLPLLCASWPGGLPLGGGEGDLALPPGWRSVPSADLQMFALYNTPFMATHARLNPRGILHNGTFDLLYSHGLEGLSGRCTMLDMMMRSEEGGHVDMAHVKSERVKAMVLQPMCTDTFMAVDGEVLPISPVFVEVHPGLCSVCVAPEFQEQQ